MIKLADLPRETLTTRKGLWKRIDYLTDADDEGHVHKVLHAPRNHNCSGETAEDFAANVCDNARRYQDHRSGKVGKRTAKIMHELIYSGVEGRILAAAEKEKVETTLIELLHATPARSAWHDDPQTGRSDLHILFAWCNGAHTSSPVLSRHYGAGKASFSYACYMAEKAINEEYSRCQSEASLRVRRRMNTRPQAGTGFVI